MFILIHNKIAGGQLQPEILPDFIRSPTLLPCALSLSLFSWLMKLFPPTWAHQGARSVGSAGKANEETCVFGETRGAGRETGIWWREVGNELLIEQS